MKPILVRPYVRGSSCPKKLLQGVPISTRFFPKGVYRAMEKSLALRLSLIAMHSLLMEMSVKILKGALEGKNLVNDF